MQQKNHSPFTSKKGNIITIRPPKRSDLDLLLNFANALIAEDTYILLSGKPLTRDDESKFLTSRLQKMKRNEEYSLLAFHNNALIGSVDLRGNTSKRKMHVADIGISILCGYREEGIGTELLRRIIDVAKSMNLRLLTLRSFDINSRALHIYEKLGFIRSGTTPGAYYYKSEYIGEVYMYLPLV